MEEVAAQPPASSLEQMASAVTAPRLGPADEELPLSPVLAASFAWAVDLGLDMRPITLRQLCDVRFIHGLTWQQRQLCWAAVRYALDLELKYGTLPELLLDSPVSSEVAEDIRGFLSTRGLLRDRQPEVLTIRDARPYIGRWIKRLLECLPKWRLTRQADSEAPADVKLIAPPTWFQPVLKPPAKPRPVRVLADPCEAPDLAARREERRALRKQVRRESLEDRHWPENRLLQSEAVHIVDSGGRGLTSQDPRFGRRLLQVNRWMPLTGQTVANLRELAEGDAWAWGLVEQLEWDLEQASQLTLADELRELVEALMPSKHANPAPTVSKADLILPRYGVGGSVLTLTEVGERNGMTRERVRQVQELFEARLSAGSVYTPRLDALRQELEAIEFAPVDELEERLAPLLGPMSVYGALDLLTRVFGLSVTGRIAIGRRNPTVEDFPVWTKSLTEAAVSSVMQQAYAMSSMVGAFLVPAIIGLVSEHAEAYVSRQQIHQILSRWKPARWIDEESGWGWVEAVERSAILHDVRRMLAVAQPISVDISDIYAGLCVSRRMAGRPERMNRFAGLMVPRWVLQAILERHPDFEVAQTDNFRLREPVDARTLMEDGTELAIFDALQRLGGIATWQQLRQVLVDEGGMNPVTFGIILKNRCWVDQPGFGVYCLRGLRLHIEQVRARGRVHQFASPNRPAPAPEPATAGDRLTMALRQPMASRATNPHRVINIPKRLEGLIVPGEYQHQSGNGCTIWLGPTQVSRLPNELSDAGVGPGTPFHLTLNAQDKTYKWVLVGEANEGQEGEAGFVGAGEGI